MSIIQLSLSLSLLTTLLLNYRVRRSQNISFISLVYDKSSCIIPEMTLSLSVWFYILISEFEFKDGWWSYSLNERNSTIVGHISETWSVKSVTVKMVSSSHCHGAMVVMYCSIKILAIKTCQSYISLCAVVLTNNNDTTWYITVYTCMPSYNFFTKWYRQYTS